MTTPNFEAKVYSVNTADRINHMNEMTIKQNKIAQLGGAGTVTVPQYPTTGLPAGPNNANHQIVGMAEKQMQASALGGYNHCVGQPKGTCGGSRRRRRRRSRRSRKYKVKH